MKYAFGLIIFALSFQVSADGMLILRGRVPASFSVEVDKTSKQAHLKTNTSSSSKAPKMIVTHSKKHTLVSIIQR